MWNKSGMTDHLSLSIRVPNFIRDVLSKMSIRVPDCTQKKTPTSYTMTNSPTHGRVHTHMHRHTHTRKHARTHTHTHTLSLSLSIYIYIYIYIYIIHSLKHSAIKLNMRYRMKRCITNKQTLQSSQFIPYSLSWPLRPLR